MGRPRANWHDERGRSLFSILSPAFKEIGGAGSLRRGVCHRGLMLREQVSTRLRELHEAAFAASLMPAPCSAGLPPRRESWASRIEAQPARLRQAATDRGGWR